MREVSANNRLKLNPVRMAFLLALLTALVGCGVLLLPGTVNRTAKDPSHITASEASHMLSGCTHSDLATLNLRCATELLGTESLNVQEAHMVVDSMTSRVASETEKYFWKFRANPADFNSSEGYFRILTLVTVLQQDFGVHYSPERIRSPNFADSRDLFLHGLLTGKREGTCVSMPVLYVAVGRRLGYPLKLVAAKGHLFARWEGRRTKPLSSPQPSPLAQGTASGEKRQELAAYERFNIEATGQGLSCFPDEYYHTWPEPLTPEEIASGQYLNSLTPDEELAVFLSARGNCLEANARYTEARKAYADARRLAPNTTLYVALLNRASTKEFADAAQAGLTIGSGSESTRILPTP